jgi:hypothetical protein
MPSIGSQSANSRPLIGFIPQRINLRVRALFLRNGTLSGKVVDPEKQGKRLEIQFSMIFPQSAGSQRHFVFCSHDEMAGGHFVGMECQNTGPV